MVEAGGVNDNARPVELAIASAMLALTTMLSISYGMPILLPGLGSAGFVGIHYLVPMLAAGLLAGTALLTGSMRGHSQMVRAVIIGVPSFLVVLLCHFNLKIWAPHINAWRFDETLWATDQALRPLVELCIWTRQALAPAIPYEANFYMIAFIMQFYVTFAYYAIRQPAHFRELLLAVMLMQAIGAFCYLAMPAVGPFIFEHGVNPFVTQSQQQMLAVYRHSLADGPAWLQDNGPSIFAMGLGAMPSLHCAGALLFFMFAKRHAKVLLPLHIFCLLFIVMAAVANRWHYLLDIPAGALVAWSSLALAARLTRHSAVAVTSQALPPSRLPLPGT